MKNNDNIVEKSVNTSEIAVKLDKKDLRQAYNRWIFQIEMCDNYERYMALNCCNALAPALRKLYKDEEDFKNALKRHLI